MPRCDRLPWCKPSINHPFIPPNLFFAKTKSVVWLTQSCNTILHLRTTKCISSIAALLFKVSRNASNLPGSSLRSVALSVWSRSDKYPRRFFSYDDRLTNRIISGLKLIRLRKGQSDERQFRRIRMKNHHKYEIRPELFAHLDQNTGMKFSDANFREG